MSQKPWQYRVFFLQVLCKDVTKHCAYELSLMQFPVQLDCLSLPEPDFNAESTCIIHESQIPGEYSAG